MSDICLIYHLIYIGNTRYNTCDIPDMVSDIIVPDHITQCSFNFLHVPIKTSHCESPYEQGHQLSLSTHWCPGVHIKRARRYYVPSKKNQNDRNETANYFRKDV